MKTETLEQVKERPILFSTPMVKAVLDDRKDVTRRTRDLEEINKSPNDWDLVHVGGYKTTRADGSTYEGFGVLFQYRHEPRHVVDIPCPFGKPGDILWVRENLKQDNEYGISYVADGSTWQHPDDYCYRDECYNGIIPSIHMPKDACRLKLRIKSISVERLHDITEEDAIREGINKQFFLNRGMASPESMEEFGAKGYHKTGFRLLWIDINGKESWESNPWVWRIEFEKISPVS